MALSCAGVHVFEGGRNALVLIDSSERSELNGSEARKLAIEAARAHIGKCGFNQFEGVVYINPGETEPLSDEAMLKPGAMKPGGTWRRLVKVNATL